MTSPNKNLLTVAKSPIGDSSMLLTSERGSSTPKDSSRLPLLRLEPDLDGCCFSAKKNLQFPDDDASGPIFGYVRLKRGNPDSEVNFNELCDEVAMFQDARKNILARRLSRRLSIYSKPKASENHAPILTVVRKGEPKRTAMRAKLKKERVRQENEKKRQPEPSRTGNRADAKSRGARRRSTTIPMTRKEDAKRAERNARQVNIVNKRRLVDIKKQDDAPKFTPFKAQPIRKYAPLPVVKSRSITIPQSPKLGKRRLLNGASR